MCAVAMLFTFAVATMEVELTAAELTAELHRLHHLALGQTHHWARLCQTPPMGLLCWAHTITHYHTLLGEARGEHQLPSLPQMGLQLSFV